MNPHGILGYSHHCTLLEVKRCLGHNSANEIGSLWSAESLDSESDNGRLRRLGSAEQRVKVGIRSNANPALQPGPFKNLGVFGKSHPDFTDVYSIPALLPKTPRFLKGPGWSAGFA